MIRCAFKQEANMNAPTYVYFLIGTFEMMEKLERRRRYQEIYFGLLIILQYHTDIELEGIDGTF